MPEVLMRSPPRGASGESVQLLSEFGLRNRPDDLVGDDFALLDEQDRRDRTDPVAGGKARVLVHVDLGECYPPGRLARQLFPHRGPGPAGPATMRPEIQ